MVVKEVEPARHFHSRTSQIQWTTGARGNVDTGGSTSADQLELEGVLEAKPTMAHAPVEEPREEECILVLMQAKETKMIEVIDWLIANCINI